jgi:uncharacterized protein
MKKEFSFTCTGHENILSLHDKTLEFTKDEYVTKTGDCILGINADFDYKELIKFIKEMHDLELMTCTIECDGLKDEFNFILNKDFCSEHEIVFRRSDFKSDRTLGTRCTKCASDINRRIVENLKKNYTKNIVKVFLFVK